MTDLTEDALLESFAKIRGPIAFRPTVAILPAHIAAQVTVFKRFEGRDRRRIKRELRKTREAYARACRYPGQA